MKAGLVINPLAGIGGTVALKGSDGEAIVRQALQRGAKPLAQQRTLTALAPLADSAISFLTAAGDMGADVLRSLQLPHEVVYRQVDNVSTAADTEAAVGEICRRGVDLLVFAGGDGTARNVLNGLECAGYADSVTVLGIPAGCKIHSAVYAVSPNHAGDVLAAFNAGKPMPLRQSLVMDLDEDLFRKGTVKASRYGYLVTPDDQSNMQMMKQGGIDQESAAQQDIAADIVENMEPDVLYFIGSGSTTAAVMAELGLDNTLLGIDAVINGELVGTDLDEVAILETMQAHSPRIVVTPIGGQGHIFGRGNQQFSARVLREAGRENVMVIASNEKLRSLDHRPLRMDTGDHELDAEWAGSIKVITGYEQRTLYHIA